MALPLLLYSWQRPWGTMAGVLNENMLANHLILISLCSTETVDTEGESTVGRSLKWTQVVQCWGKLRLSAQSIKMPHTHLHTATQLDHWQSVVQSIFFAMTHNIERHEISEPVTWWTASSTEYEIIDCLQILYKKSNWDKFEAKQWGQIKNQHKGGEPHTNKIWARFGYHTV